MRIALVLHGFPPHERTGVANHVAQLAAALARAGQEVEVFAARETDDVAPGALEREERAAFAVTWVAIPRRPRDLEGSFEAGSEAGSEPPGVADAFEGWLAERAIDIVHFEQLVNLGSELARRAARRGIPTVFSAHDFGAISPRRTGLAPDLTTFELSDTRFLARCDLADRYLDRLARLGDRHGSVLPQDLEPHERVELEALLHGDPRAAGVNESEFGEAVRRRRALELRRREALRDIDLVLSPTEFMARKLRAHGVLAPIEIDPNGIDVEPFARSAPPRTSRAEGAVRFGFLGALVRPNGVHVLLDAFEGLAGECELSIHGGSKDAHYVERLGIHAARVGARMEGPYEPHAAAERIESFDVLVVPSIGPENSTLAMCEAFATHRPVIASRVGALEESVRDGVDGLLVTPNNPNALRAALRRCIDEDGLVAALAERIAPPRTIEDQARGLVERYARLRERPRHVSTSSAPLVSTLPASVQPFAERWRRIEALPAADVVAASIAGIARLRTLLTGRESDATPEVDLLRAIERTRLAQSARARGVECARLTQAVGERDALLSSAEDRARALETTVASLTAERAENGETRTRLERELVLLRTRAEHAEAHSRWMVDKNQSSERARVALERSGSEQAAQIETLRAEAAALVSEREARDAEIAWLRSVDVQRVAELEWARGERTANENELKDVRRALQDLRASSDARIEVVEARLREAELRGEESIAHGERLGQRIEQLERELADSNAECARRRETIEGHARELESRTQALAARDGEITALRTQLAARDTEIETLKWDTDFLARETAWREREMDAVRESLSALQFKFVGRGLRERAQSWTLREKRARRGEQAP
jgi:glycosyltransferase involved in cell wall biosynthesis